MKSHSTKFPPSYPWAIGCAATLSLAITALGAPEPKAGSIPVRFSLDAASYVTLVIEDASGNRVRNLIAETKLPAGDNLFYWDVLRGNRSQTIQRQYWNNLNTAFVSDVPSEARLQPRNWGIWKLVPEAPVK